MKIMKENTEGMNKFVCANPCVVGKKEGVCIFYSHFNSVNSCPLGIIADKYMKWVKKRD